VRALLRLSSSDPKAIVTGTPLRESIAAVDRAPDSIAAARERIVPPVEAARTVVVVMTGSLGSTRVNHAVTELARRWSLRRDRTIIHVAGRRDGAQVRADAPVTDGLDYRILEFGDMVELWACVTWRSVARERRRWPN